MPIRFRCVYCNQLLGISRRKAGTIVRCTSCEGQLIVPDPNDAATVAGGSDEHAAEPPAEHPENTEGSAGNAGVFDAEEFDAFLEPFSAASSAVASPPAPLARRPAAGPLSLPPATMIEARPSAALTLTRRGLTIAVVLIVLGLGLAFAGGLLLGLALR